MGQLKTRESNMELLRIVAMIAVIGVHLDGASLDLPAPSGSILSVPARDWWCLIVESFTIIGVNCFTLISGYFGIKASMRSFSRFTGQCVFYSVGICTTIMILKVASGTGEWQWAAWGESWLVFTHSDLWYVPAYLGLFILSPVLNASVKSMTKKQFGVMLATFVALNVYAGWLWGGRFNANGYTIVQLMLMYLIGRYIGEYIDFGGAKRKKLQIGSFITYVATSLMIALSSIYIDNIRAFAYNSPLVILSSVALFTTFATLRLQSEVINRLATSAFAAYLIHKNPHIWVEYLRPFVRSMWNESDLSTFTVRYIGFTIAIFLASVVIDQFRIALSRHITVRVNS